MVTDNNTINKFNINFFYIFLSKKLLFHQEKLEAKQIKKFFYLKPLNRIKKSLKKVFLFLLAFG